LEQLFERGQIVIVYLLAARFMEKSFQKTLEDYNGLLLLYNKANDED